MFAAQRQEIIKELLIKNKSIDVASLTAILNVSDVTARKDLDKLEADGFLIKTHGGAILVENDAPEQPLSNIQNFMPKKRIAQLAFTLVEKDDSIFVGQGTTCLQLLEHIKKNRQLSVVTNNVPLAGEIMGFVKNVYLIGGELGEAQGIPYTSGSNSFNYLEGMFVNKAFISVSGVDIMAGLTCDSIQEANILRAVLKISRSVVVLADHTKFNRIGMYNIAPLSEISCLVTDECSHDEYRIAMYKKNIKFLTVFDI